MSAAGGGPEGKGTDGPPPLRMRDYSLTSMATGLSARNVRELRERVEHAPAASLFHHFWGRLLRSDPEVGEYGNDLAEWAVRHLKDPVLAERLALVDPLRLDGPDALRDRLCEVLEERMEELEAQAAETRPEDAFHFVADQMVIYDTGPDVARPEDLPAAVRQASDAALFLHFVRPRLAAGGDGDEGGEGDEARSAAAWVRSFGPAWEPLADRLDGLDVFLAGPAELRRRILDALGEQAAQP